MFRGIYSVMFYRNSLFFIFLCILLLNFVRSDILQKNCDHTTETHEEITKTTLQEPLGDKRRREFAERYLNELAQVTENWIDPYDMIGYPSQKRTKLPTEPTSEQFEGGHRINDVKVETEIESKDALNGQTKVTQFSPAELESGLRGDIVGEKVYEADETATTNEQTKVPQLFSPPELESDEKLTFSDIRRDIKGERLYVADETTPNIDVKPVGSFTKGRQIDNVYISRWLKKLVLKIEKESILVPNIINFPVNQIAFNNLKELSTANSLDLSQLDELISKMIDQSSIVGTEDFDWTVTDYAKDLLWPVTICIVLVVCTYTVYRGILHRPLFTSLCCVSACSVFWHWMHLYKQRQALKLAELSSMTVPADCRKHEFGLIQHFHEYLKSFFSSNECAKYYEALTVDPFWEVSITVAISEAVTSMLFQPLSAISRYLNLAIRQLFDGLSIFTIVPLLIFLFLILIMLCNYRIRFPFFMGALEPYVAPVGSRVQELKPVTALKDTLRRKLSLEGERKSLLQGSDVCMDTCKVTKKCRCTQYFSEEDCTQQKLNDLPEQLNVPSRINSVYERSASKDDISIIDSEDNNKTGTENSFIEPGCQQNSGVHPDENRGRFLAPSRNSTT